MKNIFLHIRNKISAAYTAEKQRWEEQTGGDFNAFFKQGLVTLGIVVCILLVLGFKDLYESNKLSKYGVETYSTVVEIRYFVKHRDYMATCRFHVNGKEYQARDPINKPLKYGDTLRVLYYPENPRINRLLIPDSLNINIRIKD